MKNTLRVYNATGVDLSFLKTCSWGGEYGVKPPAIIKTDEEAIFDIAAEGSDPTWGAFLYRVPPFPNQPGVEYDCMVAFYDPKASEKQVLCECAQKDYFTDKEMDRVKVEVKASGTQFNRYVYEVVLTFAVITQEKENPTCVATIGKYVK